MFKRLYKNQSVREQGTLVYFREKMNRRNVTHDVKHYEDCEQYFLSVGKCFVIEALMEFFGMDSTNQLPKMNISIHSLLPTADLEKQFLKGIDNFLDKYIFPLNDGEAAYDGILSYSVNLITSYMILTDFKDAVSSGNGEYLATLHKQLLTHFFSGSGFNSYAIEMLISIVQNEVLLSEAEAHKNKWASTVNWKGGPQKNIEIDLLQENRNKDIKLLIKNMGANKTDSSIKRVSKASAGVRNIIDAFDHQVNRQQRSSAHSPRSSLEDEEKIRADLRVLRPFQHTAGRSHDSFPGIPSDPLDDIDHAEFDKWLTRHKKNIVMHFPVESADGVDIDGENN